MEMDKVKCPSCGKVDKPEIKDYSTWCKHCGYEYKIGRNRFHLSMKIGGPSFHKEWDLNKFNPGECQYCQATPFPMDNYLMCWHPKVAIPKPTRPGFLDLDDVLCSPEHCPLSEEELSRIRKQRKGGGEEND